MSVELWTRSHWRFSHCVRTRVTYFTCSLAVYDEALHNWPLAWAASILCGMLATLSPMSFNLLSNLSWKQHSANLLSMCLTWQHFLQQLNWWSKGKSEGELLYVIGQQFSWSQVLDHLVVASSVYIQTLFRWVLTQMQVCGLHNAILSMVEKILGSTPNHEQVWFFLLPVLPSCITYSHMPCQAVQALQEVNSQDTWSLPKTEPCHWEKIIFPARVHCSFETTKHLPACSTPDLSLHVNGTYHTQELHNYFLDAWIVSKTVWKSITATLQPALVAFPVGHNPLNTLVKLVHY